MFRLVIGCAVWILLWTEKSIEVLGTSAIFDFLHKNPNIFWGGTWIMVLIILALHGYRNYQYSRYKAKAKYGSPND